ncbi:hypothetical protein HHK36_023122 [Tetracentron sinense]|uniref:C3H1-type domain-containing protein n=1 Tax=Tetracentron sinense TaxID=13715 RepID=A0A835D543_TETSI|nr:hypothetical protein HHK36_023122 [Tetracentron sinense]
MLLQSIRKRRTPRITSSSSFLFFVPSLSPNQTLPAFHSLATTPQSYKPRRERILPSFYDPSSSSCYASLLQTCIDRRAIKPGKQLHAHLLLTGLGYNIVVATKLVNLYSVCDSLSTAHLLFDRIPKDNLFLWNVLIRGYAWNGPQQVALSLYYQMLDYGLQPDNFTFPFVLKACSTLSALQEGRDIHQHVIRSKWESDVFVGAALIDMYAKCGCVETSRQVFDKIIVRDVVLWNSMLAAYSHNGHPDEALSLCREMALAGLRLTVATLVTVISASADIAALPQGREVHGFSWRRGFESQDKVKTALVDMYAKSGLVKVARRLFERLMERRVVSWNAMIAGYAMHGHTTEALTLFEEMKKEEARPDHITFVGVLSACSHGGLMDEGWNFFESMVKVHLIKPTVQHYTCMVDLLGHSGRLDEAYNLITQMTEMPDSGIWGALLNSCKIHGNVELGERALDRLIDLEPNDAGNYVILSNIYAQAGKWEGVAKVRKLMTERGLKKSIACSWIEVKNKVHAFLAGDISHPQSDEIYAELERLRGLMKEAGYVPDTTPVFHDVEDDEKTSMVCSHSEKLAIAFGLISTPPGARLLVTKNLRVCDDCHMAIKFISRITEREITVRDVNRYHHFKDAAAAVTATAPTLLLQTWPGVDVGAAVDLTIVGVKRSTEGNLLHFQKPRDVGRAYPNGVGPVSNPAMDEQVAGGLAIRMHLGLGPPQRPGQIECDAAIICSFYKKNGTCKYGVRCRFHHPPPGETIAMATVQGTREAEYGSPEKQRKPMVGKLGLGPPQRPGQIECDAAIICSFYKKNGTCKYGVRCRFHHPPPGETIAMATVQGTREGEEETESTQEQQE